jgi:hypothetical protein
VATTNALAIIVANGDFVLGCAAIGLGLFSIFLILCGLNSPGLFFSIAFIASEKRFGLHGIKTVFGPKKRI